MLYWFDQDERCILTTNVADHQNIIQNNIIELFVQSINQSISQSRVAIESEAHDGRNYRLSVHVYCMQCF